MQNALKFVGVALAAGLLVTFGYLAKEPDVVNTTTEVPKEIGALSGPDIPFNYFSFGNVRRFALAKSLATATTTICAIQSPAATSTLVLGTAAVRNASTTTMVLTVAKSASPNASTTSLLPDVSIGSLAQAEVVATSTIGSLTIFGPNQWLTISAKGGAGVFSPVGQCNATFEALTSII